LKKQPVRFGFGFINLKQKKNKKNQPEQKKTEPNQKTSQTDLNWFRFFLKKKFGLVFFL